MSDIPYSVRDKSTRVNAIKGLNFDSIYRNELFKKQDANNVTGANLFSTSSALDNKLELWTEGQVLTELVGTIKGETTGSLTKLYLNTRGFDADGMTITSQGKVGIGTTNPTRKLEVNGDIEGDNLYAQTFGPTYTALPSLIGKIGQIVDAPFVGVTLVAYNDIQVRSLTIPYTGVWAIDMSLFLGNATLLTGDIRYNTQILINGVNTQRFHGTNVTGVDGSCKRNLNANDVVSFITRLAGADAGSMTESERLVFGPLWTFLSATRIA